MDIFTHAGIGLVAASSFLSSRPELALGIAAGSVLPDLDALVRLRGKVAYLHGHQTWSHALFPQLVVSAACGLLAGLADWNGPELGVGLLAGMTLHSLLDITNTFGVAWLFPFSRRRFCLSWVFFIDGVFLVGTILALALVIPHWLRDDPFPVGDAALFFAFLATYIFAKGLLKLRASRLCPPGSSLTPSALIPWRFFATERAQQTLISFHVNALTGKRLPLKNVPLFDDSFSESLRSLPEFRIMREVSYEYHVVEVARQGAETRLLCRDMRIRNFGTRFGDLEVWLDSDHKIVRRRFYA